MAAVPMMRVSLRQNGSTHLPRIRCLSLRNIRPHPFRFGEQTGLARLLSSVEQLSLTISAQGAGSFADAAPENKAMEVWEWMWRELISVHVLEASAATRPSSRRSRSRAASRSRTWSSPAFSYPALPLRHVALSGLVFTGAHATSTTSWPHGQRQTLASLL